MSDKQQPIVFIKPPKPLAEMTPEEISEWAKEAYRGFVRDIGGTPQSKTEKSED